MSQKAEPNEIVQTTNHAKVIESTHRTLLERSKKSQPRIRKKIFTKAEINVQTRTSRRNFSARASSAALASLEVLSFW